MCSRKPVLRELHQTFPAFQCLDLYKLHQATFFGLFFAFHRHRDQFAVVVWLSLACAEIEIVAL